MEMVEKKYTYKVYELKEETTSLKNLPLGWREVTPAERETAVRILGSNSNIRISFLSETGSQ